MFSVILFLILVASFFVGMRRGMILQLVHLLGFVVSLIVAYLYYQELASYIRLWIPYPQLTGDDPISMFISSFDFENVYYSGIAFAILFFGTRILLQIIGSMVDVLAQLPILRMINRWLGGALAVIETYLLLFIVLHVAALLPIDFVQELLHGSFVAQLILNYTPFLSAWIKDLWISSHL
ncbi:CvpA family protein [Desertibacillus haloalkaliphilus]|uniref:CvpA family protein n=1 Tax=Desertibacillus haloalkaliphilus TaxID=1328930 RepID=UPI001C25CA4E|nr:CvpA family protein [Desertibacillus haloalkaliphilus]MBU8905115.1 CvpA family protein [Desertibacillus haloalkaliphilus]